MLWKGGLCVDHVFAAGKAAGAASTLSRSRKLGFAKLIGRVCRADRGRRARVVAASRPQAGADTLDTIIGMLGQLVEKRRDREAVELPADVPHMPWMAKA